MAPHLCSKRLLIDKRSRRLVSHPVPNDWGEHAQDGLPAHHRAGASHVGRPGRRWPRALTRTVPTSRPRPRRRPTSRPTGQPDQQRRQARRRPRRPGVRGLRLRRRRWWRRRYRWRRDWWRRQHRNSGQHRPPEQDPAAGRHGPAGGRPGTGRGDPLPGPTHPALDLNPGAALTAAGAAPKRSPWWARAILSSPVAAANGEASSVMAIAGSARVMIDELLIGALEGGGYLEEALCGLGCWPLSRVRGGRPHVGRGSREIDLPPDHWLFHSRWTHHEGLSEAARRGLGPGCQTPGQGRAADRRNGAPQPQRGRCAAAVGPADPARHQPGTPTITPSG